jgi:hypothetical protein
MTMEGRDSNDFMQLSEEVAKKFLHTIVVVDDEATFEKKSTSPKVIRTPPRRGRDKDNGSSPDDEPKRGTQHSLNAKEVIDNFASKGIVCSILKPEKESDWDLFKSVAKRTDVFIIDWEINNDGGDTAVQIIDDIINSDTTQEPRLRLLIIYTGETDVDIISSKIQTKLKELFGDNFKVTDNEATFTRGHLRIGIYLKNDIGIAPKFDERVIHEKDLSRIVSSEFSKITAGLISNVALESISILRDNTHLILGKLGPQIDPPYLTHRVWVDNPDDAMDYAVEIINSEFRSVLENHEVRHKVDSGVIKKWLEFKNPDNKFVIHGPNSQKEFDLDEIEKLIEKGIEHYRKEKKCNIGKNWYKSFTKTFCFGDDDDDNVLDNKFAILTTNFCPFLTQGTILKSESSNASVNYWLCIQPRCDCVRIDEKRDFYFLPLNDLEKEDDEFDIVIPGEDEAFVKLKIGFQTYNGKAFEFQVPNSDEKVIKAEPQEESFVFKTHDGKKFTWIAEMKYEQIQRVAHEFASRLSRVGLNEYEWLRLWAKRKE